MKKRKKNNMKSRVKNIYNKLSAVYLWYKTIFTEHKSSKLTLYHRVRSIIYGFSRDFYHMYELEKNNPKDYIPEYKRLLSRNINDNYKVIFDNKLIFEKIFSKYVDVPSSIVIVLELLYDIRGNIINCSDLKKLLVDEKYIIKPFSDTGGGNGVELLYHKDDKYYIGDNNYSIQNLYDYLVNKKGYIINKYIQQHEYSEKINPNSVNTIRIITIKDHETGNIIIPCAVHRFGSKKSNFVDNVSSGGFVTNININTGILLETKCCSDSKTYNIHPDTKVNIYGTKIPHWKSITKKILSVAKEFPYLEFIAWDVVVTDNGFSVIEINASTSLELFQVFGSIKNTKFGDFYTYHGYLKK